MLSSYLVACLSVYHQCFTFQPVDSILPIMSTSAAVLLLCFTIAILGFATWQLFLGRLEAAFSALPFLVILYLFVAPWKKQTPRNQQP